MPEPRSAGKLHIGSVIYTGDTFSVEMVFVPRHLFSREDEIKSAALAAARHFMQLLYQNGFRDHGLPETKVVPHGDNAVLFYIACKARKRTPAIIMVGEPREPEKPDAKPAEGGDQVRDKT